jgi:hypothetical protein
MGTAVVTTLMESIWAYSEVEKAKLIKANAVSFLIRAIILGIKIEEFW